MLFIKGERIDYDKITVKTVKAYIDGDPQPKTLQEIQSYLNKTIKVDINIEGTHRVVDLLSDKPLKIKKGA